jgi:serine/threonine protein kinase
MRRLPSAEKRRIRSETEILAELQHPNIISFYHVWENKEKDQICFTTEIVTSGTLKQYTNRVKGIKLKVMIHTPHAARTAYTASPLDLCHYGTVERNPGMTAPTAAMPHSSRAHRDCSALLDCGCVR